MNQAFVDYYRCPARFADFTSAHRAEAGKSPGFFLFGPGLSCYGRSTVAVRAEVTDKLSDSMAEVRRDGASWVLPFDPTEVADNLRLERYVPQEEHTAFRRLRRQVYYALRPLLPVFLRRHLQRTALKGWEKKAFPQWPVDSSVDQLFARLMELSLQASPSQKVPFIWFWPDNRSGCAMMTHDVETGSGLDFVGRLMDMNDLFDIKSSFQVIPDGRYRVRSDVLATMKARGFEVNIHDLKHDGHLFQDESHFRQAAARINAFAQEFGSKGFRSAILYRKQEWFDALHVSYDMSVANVGHLDPQAGGCCTVMPYFVGDVLELPVTTTQDYTLFHVLGSYAPDLWLSQISTILDSYGLVSFIVHPDYLDSPASRDAYTALLGHLSELRAEANLWIALPHEVDTWWRQRSRMTLVPDGDAWKIVGPGAERARIAYATIENSKVTYLRPELL